MSDEAGHIDAIVGSRTFQKASALRALLRYLWDHRHEDVSEYAIAVDALGRPPDFEPKVDATVRVQVARLRQKLKEYYDEEGHGAAQRIAIPLGKYQIEVHEQAAPEPPSAPCTHEPTIARMKAGLIALGALAFALAVACGLLIARQSRAAGVMAADASPAGRASAGGGLHPFWQRFFGDAPTTRLVLSHPVFFRWDGSTLKVRDVQVNDYKDFEKSPELGRLIAQHGRPLLMQNYTVAADTFAALQLVRYVEGRGRRVTVISSAEWSIDPSSEADNLILLGTAGVTHRFHHLFERTNFLPTAEGDGLVNRQPRPGERAEYAVAVESLTRRTAPGLIALLPAGPRGGRLLALIGVETAALAQFLSAQSTLATLEQAWRSHGSPPFFEAVVEAEVNSGTVLKADLLAFRSFAPTP